MKKNIIWKILIYFIIYSIIGFFLETVYAIFTKGTLESRQSFLYGPFCIVYGVGAICLIFALKKYKNQNMKLFFYGMILGATIEYLSSYLPEIVLHVKWWDYSADFLNIHGRTCLYYAVMWGGLTIVLINYINPFFDKYINKFLQQNSPCILKFYAVVITTFMIFDATLTCYALDNFLIRVSKEYDMHIYGIDETKHDENDFVKMFSNEKMMMTYPNLIVVNNNNENILLENVLNDVQNYYYKFGVAK